MKTVSRQKGSKKKSLWRYNFIFKFIFTLICYSTYIDHYTFVYNHRGNDEEQQTGEEQDTLSKTFATSDRKVCNIVPESVFFI